MRGSRGKIAEFEQRADNTRGSVFDANALDAQSDDPSWDVAQPGNSKEEARVAGLLLAGILLRRFVTRPLLRLLDVR
jgi:hypothetical protein